MIGKLLNAGTPHCARYNSVDALLIGGGRAGINILQIFDLYGWLHLHGVVDRNENAAGMQLARSLGVPTYLDVPDALTRFKGDLVIDATGDSNVASEVERFCTRASKEYISSKSAKLLFHLAHTHVKERQEIQEKSTRVEMLKTMLQIYQKLGEQPAGDSLLSQGMHGSAKFVVSQKAIALECDKEKLRILGGLGLEELPTALPEQLFEGLIDVLRDEADEPVIELSSPIKLPNIPGHFELAVPLFIDGNLRYLLLFQVEGRLSESHRGSLTTLISHLQHALETENRQRMLLELAYRDPLTGVYNRRFLDERLHQEADRFQRTHHGRLAVMFIDLDHFKSLNDRFGHVAADQALHRVAQSVHEKLRSYDVLARYGGDEFVALLLGVEEEHARQIARRVLSVASELQAEHNDSTIYGQLSLSVGISLAETGSKIDTTELLESADQALYKAKENGRKQFYINNYRSN